MPAPLPNLAILVAVSGAKTSVFASKTLGFVTQHHVLPLSPQFLLLQLKFLLPEWLPEFQNPWF
jgi:hypothetical protein